MGLTLFLWRHPRPAGAEGRCIGRTELAVDPRKVKRLAHRMRRQARRHHLAPLVFSSPMGRCADVGRCLARWGWQHRIDPRLNELDFGAWEGLSWDAIEAAQVEAWCADFNRHAPGGGESLAALFDRCEQFVADVASLGSVCVVAHAGWINAARFVIDNEPAPGNPARWPKAIAWGQHVMLSARQVSPLPMA